MTPARIRNDLIVELHVPDFDPIREFYGQFGFIQAQYDPATDNDLGYLVIMREDRTGRAEINFFGGRPEVAEHGYFSQFPATTPRGYGVEITVPVEDVEDLWNRVGCKLSPDQISQPLRLKQWGKRDFRVADPFGFYIRFTELVDWGQNK
jgi:uncharacterized glyoxalase superfamily protein PhnB